MLRRLHQSNADILIKRNLWGYFNEPGREPANIWAFPHAPNTVNGTAVNVCVSRLTCINFLLSANQQSKGNIVPLLTEQHIMKAYGGFEL
jgi:hypothetical protein